MPTAIHQISAPDLKQLLESADPPVLVDVRTEHERAIAAIAGSELLTRESYARLVALDRHTPIVFQCHHGIRSQAAAEHFAEQGFDRVYNLAGGIDAWSLLVDPAVPRY
jgi:monothiol glutaredoxin